MKTHAVFEFENTTNIPKDKLAFQLVSELAISLQSKGVQTRKVRPGHFWFGFTCEIDQTELVVGMYDSFRHAIKSLNTSVISCSNHFPWWKSLLHRYTDLEWNSGKPLEKLVGIVQEILKADSRYSSVGWMTERDAFKDLESNDTQ
jgi:hypothetical protein